jgi:hypothetical protein
MSDALSQYKQLLQHLSSVQALSKGGDSPEEDDLLDRMDGVWFQLTPEEQLEMSSLSRSVSPNTTGSLASPEQRRWFALQERMGSEEAARKELARKLRLAADQVERRSYPDVFGCVCDPGELCTNNFIERISVTLSFPWPG